MSAPESTLGGTPGNSVASTLVSADVRRHNLSVVARYLVDNGPSSRSRIAAGTGLTRGAVTALTNVLTNAAILHESAPVSRTGKGRPVTLLTLAADDIALVAVQLDADEATAVVANLAGETLYRTAEQHGRPMGDPGAVLDVLARVAERALDAAAKLGRRVAELTVVVFAPVGGAPARVLADTDLGWGAVDVLGGLRARVSADAARNALNGARLVADSTVAARAEHSLLADINDMIYLKSNSGIGGALIVDGRLVQGVHRLAGALGHLPIVFDGVRCECGQRGCLVTVAGPDAVLEAAGLGAMLQRDGLSSALAELIRRIHAGDRAAVAAWDAAAVWIGRVLQVLTMSLDPQAIVLGGYWAELVEPVAREFAGNHPSIADADPWAGPAIVPGRLGSDAALLGAVWSARDRLLDDLLTLAVP
ncbi:ROK family protein [Rathayibacter soli]|uniref:ROK family protein n=1 Tax=Rathayibacter soli TaxID=3144168 RepID=UPI0027E3FE17|nr:ROK family protein [Glaciibacter superstes]